MMLTPDAIETLRAKYGKPILDWDLQLTLNYPAYIQMYVKWWEQEPDLYDALQKSRAAAGIIVDNDLGDQPEPQSL